jgi:hypothetical protein
MSIRELPEARDDQDRQILQWVAEYGWAVLGIEEDEDGPPYTFSVGLWRGWKHPEIVIFGLKHEASQVLINNLGLEIREGRTFEPGQEYLDLVPSYPVCFIEVHPAWVREFFGYACWFNRGDDFPVLQCVWPDRAGRFPWQEGYDVAFLTRQPLLNATPGMMP